MKYSLEINGENFYETEDCKLPYLQTSIHLLMDKPQSQETTQNTISYSILLKTPNKEYCFQNNNFILFTSPVDEISVWKDSLIKFINNTKQKKYRFEPIEPIFELIIERDEPNGFKLFFWIDNGSWKTGYSTWDSLGIRLYITENNLQNLINQLCLLNFQGELEEYI